MLNISINKKVRKFSGPIRIHSAVLLFGLAGLFGKSLTISPLTIVAGRTFFATLFILLLQLISRDKKRGAEKPVCIKFLLLGFLLALHWVTFFKAIQLSTVAIGLLTYATYPIFVALIESLFLKTRLALLDLVMVLAVVCGLVLIIPEYRLSSSITIGALYGTISGLTFALLTVFNRQYVQHFSAFTIAGWENAGAFLLLLPMVWRSIPALNFNQMTQLIFLGIFCTAGAHTLFIQGLHSVKAQTASIIATLEPVYGILLAFLIIGEMPTLRTIAGGAIIVVTSVVITVKSRTIRQTDIIQLSNE